MNIGNFLIKLQKGSILSNLSRNYAFKSNLKIKWVRPEKVLCYKPEKSGDLEQISNIDLTKTQKNFRNCKELEDADPIVKRLFTLKFAPHSETVSVYIDEMKGRVKRHDYDSGSIESKIARWTGGIRAMQEVMENHPRNKRVKVNLKELIDKRKKHLKYLRRWDYKKFEWLLESLNIVYKPPPTESRWVTRKESLTKLTDIYCKDVVQDKLNEYKAILQIEQPSFLEEKIRTLEFIKNEQEECGAKVTVSQDEIDAVKKQLEELKLKNVKEDKDD
nr:28S ribosomal protein S15, mitochondrial [Onthophagus taurus]